MKKDDVNIALYLPFKRIDITENKTLPIFIGKEVVGTVRYQIIDGLLCLDISFTDANYQNVMSVARIENVYLIQVFKERMVLISHTNFSFESESVYATKEPYYLFCAKTKPSGFVLFN